VRPAVARILSDAYRVRGGQRRVGPAVTGIRLRVRSEMRAAAVCRALLCVPRCSSAAGRSNAFGEPWQRSPVLSVAFRAAVRCDRAAQRRADRPTA
jgi:hypothetical protein